MKNIHVRTAKSADHDWLVKAIADEQEYEHTLHDTRKPGAEVAKPYLAHLEESVSQKSGVILVAEIGSTFAGYAACWIEQENALTETDDSNRSGYVADAYVVPALRAAATGRPRPRHSLMERREIVLRTGVLMPQAGGLSLAVNTAALRHNCDARMGELGPTDRAGRLPKANPRFMPSREGPAIWHFSEHPNRSSSIIWGVDDRRR
jgi:hypothetical protein